jgi:transposase
MRQKRIAFAKKHQHWTAQDWTKVMFSDESTFQQFTVRHSHVRRPRGTRYDEKYTISTMKHPPSQMIWGGITSKGTAGLHFLPPKVTMNGERYKNMLRDGLKKQMKEKKCSIFMQDGAPCHRCKLVKTYLQSAKIKLLDWPGNSPDLNPIENLWSYMKDKVAEKRPSNAQDLRSVIEKIWRDNITPDYCDALIRSMPRRIQSVLSSKGGHTKY